MNCGDFDVIITDLAGEQLIDATRYKIALAHKNTCARCEARLANERSLTKALHTVANAETEQAPAHTKAALLQAFAERMPSSVALPISPVALAETSEKTVLAFTPKAQRLPLWTWAAAAAAVLAIVSLAAIQIAKSTSSSAALQAYGVEAITIPKVKEPKEINTPQPPKKQNPVAEKFVATIKNAKRNLAPRRMEVKEKSERVEEQVAENEITTDYIPLTYFAGTTAIESGQVVRVMVSRSSLLAYGLPVDLERTDEKIKADLVVGDDGLARAIRFVYPSKK
jgi:hypothetical protein